MKDDKLKKVSELFIMMGKHKETDFLKSIQMKPQQYLCLNPQKIIVPEKYDGNQNNGYDIAIIGFEESHLEILETFFESVKNTNRFLYFEDKKIKNV